ncbi:MAG: STAS domain-containing protein [Armatimonadetes bacterium]|nr:STAS domain-containing protein [Armatimonadota bacterium]
MLAVDHDGVVVASLEGEVDMANAAEVRAQLHSSLSSNAVGVVIDLTRTTYVDSRGIYLLVETHERVQTSQQPLRIVCPAASPIRRLLLVSHLPIPVDSTVEEAIQQIRQTAG